MPGLPRTGGPTAPVQFSHGLIAPQATPPGPPVLTGCATDKNGRLSFTALETGGAPASYLIERSADGVIFTDITSNCITSGVGSGAGTVIDLRPNYAANGAAKIPIGSVGYYRLRAVGVGITTAYSNVISATSNYDRTAVEVDIYTNFSIRMGTNATEHDGNCGWAYPGYQWLVASYAACLLPAVRTQALIDLQDWWNTSKTHLNADGLYQWETSPAVPAPYANSSSAFVMGWQYNVEFGNYALVCARLLNKYLPTNPTATSIATDLRTKANTLGKAMIDKFVRYAVTNKNGYGANWPTVAGANSWSAGVVTALDAIIRPTVTNGRMYRCITAGTTGSLQPIWPTTDRGYVTDGTVTWQECTNDIPFWTAGATVPIGMIYRPSSPNFHTYRALNAGTTGVTEPTWPSTGGATVNDNGITWQQTGCDASIFWGYYDKTTYAATNNTCVTDFLYETAAFFTALMADTNLPDFQSGTYKTSATTIANDALNLGGTAQVGCGAVVQNLGVHGGDLVNYYDTSYGSFIGHSAALINLNQGDALSLAITKRLADWFDSDFGTESHVSNRGFPDGLAGTFDRSEFGFRLTIFTRAGRLWNLNPVIWDSSTQPSNVGNYTQSGLAPTPDAADGNFPMVALAIDAALATRFSDAQAGTLALAGSTTESLTHTGTGSGSQTLTGTATESRGSTDSGSGTLTLTGSDTEHLTFTNIGAGTLTVAGSNSESLTHTGTGTSPLILGGTQVENLSRGLLLTMVQSQLATLTQGRAFLRGLTTSVNQSTAAVKGVEPTLSTASSAASVLTAIRVRLITLLISQASASTQSRLTALTKSVAEPTSTGFRSGSNLTKTSSASPTGVVVRQTAIGKVSQAIATVLDLRRVSLSQAANVSTTALLPKSINFTKLAQVPSQSLVIKATGVIVQALLQAIQQTLATLGLHPHHSDISLYRTNFVNSVYLYDENEISILVTIEDDIWNVAGIRRTSYQRLGN